MSLFTDCFKKIYLFLIIPDLKNKSIQVDLNFEIITKSSQTQTQTRNIEIVYPEYNNNSSQTDIKLTDICNDNEWANLTWCKTDLIDII